MSDIKCNENIENDIDFRQEQIEKLFIKLKDSFIKEYKLLKRFYDFSNMYENFEYDEQGLNMDDADDILRKANKIRDKFLDNVANRLNLQFEQRVSNTLLNTISFELTKETNQFKINLELLEDSFNLEVL